MSLSLPSSSLVHFLTLYGRTPVQKSQVFQTIQYLGQSEYKQAGKIAKVYCRVELLLHRRRLKEHLLYKIEIEIASTE